MTLFEILLSASAVCLSGSAIAYTLHVVRRTAEFENPDHAKVLHMIETAPRGAFGNELAR